MKNRKSEIKPIKIEKDLEQGIVLGIKNIRRILGEEK